MYWSTFFHIYQPPDQNLDILERIVNESYRPLIKGWLATSSAKVTLNINACLTEMLLKNKFTDVIDGLIELAIRGQLEFTASAKYHPFLPILPKSEMIRQIELNEETNSKIFGAVYQPLGFFPPEMGYSREVGDVVREMGYKWIILDEIAYSGKVDQVRYDRLYKLSKQLIHSAVVDKRNFPAGSKSRFARYDSSENLFVSPQNDLYIFFRERRMSNLIMSAMLRTPQSLWEALEGENSKNRYLITAMDGETFGHHRPGLDTAMMAFYQDDRYQFVLMSKLIDLFSKQQEEIDPISACWASSEKEISEGKNFYLYYNPENKLHVLQKKLIDLVIASGSREMIDHSLSCNHMWWSNPDGWWSLEEIERGAYSLKSAILALSSPKKDPTLLKAENLYRQILDMAFSWQRSGLVRKLHEEKETFKKIPFKDRAKAGEYEAILEILIEEEEKAVKNKEYELAIRWRDSRYKLEKGLDLYDYVHIVDQMRLEGKLEKYQELARKYKSQYNKLAPGQPEK